MGAFLNGRVTYELMAGFWPTADADPGSTPPVKEFARIWRDMPKVVYSKTLTSAGWNTTIARDVVRGEVEELKLRARGDLVVGGGDLAAAFMGQDPSRDTWTKRITFLIASSPAVAKALGAPRGYTGADGLPRARVHAPTQAPYSDSQSPRRSRLCSCSRWSRNRRRHS